MNITVKKPTEQEKAEMQSMPTWGCDVSEFDWYYDSEETCLIIEGEVEVTPVGARHASPSPHGHASPSTHIHAGDYVIFPKGLSCVWKVTKPIRKHYVFK